jgi:ribonuclease J
MSKNTKLQITPIGGLGEVGKNMMIARYGNEAIIIDAGMMFPENDMLGVDYIIPDFRYFQKQPDLKVLAIIITHGHEDHTGAITHVADAFRVPIYATPLTKGLLEIKIRNAKMQDRTTLKVFKAGDTLDIGPFSVETFHVCHSIPDCVGLGINTPVGLIVHTGDFKFDYTPVDGKMPDFAKLAEFSSRGVLALFSDSTNAEKAGWTPSESVIDAAFDRVFRQAPGRVFVSTFASLISRIQQVAWAAERHKRRIVVVGHSMNENIRMAQQMGYLVIPEGTFVTINEAKNIPDNQLVILATGTQGEPSSVLSRLARNNHQQIQIVPNDTVVISAHPIPGNEEMVSETINRLIQQGATVVYEPIEQVHVSGHASQEEQKLMISLVRPKYFVPIHGALRQLKQHALLAEQLGIPADHIAVVENGNTLEFDHQQKMSVGERVPGGYVFVDGSLVGDVGPAVMRDREALGRDGVVMVEALYDRKHNEIVSGPNLVQRGFVFEDAAQSLLNSARETVKQIIYTTGAASHGKDTLNRQIEDALRKYLHDETHRRPMVFSYINIID